MTALPEVAIAEAWAPAESHVGERSVHVVHDLALDELWEQEYQTWARDRRLPTTARARWVFAELDEVSAVQPWAVVARHDGVLRGMLVLIDEPMNGQTVTTLAGSDQGHRGVIAADSGETAELLARALATELRGRVDLSRLLLGPLHADDPATHAFVAGLPGAQIIADAPIPRVSQESADVRDYLSTNMARTLRKGRNRLAADGLSLAVRFTTDLGEIEEIIPQLERCHRDRDHAHGRRSDLDDDRARRLWGARLERLARVRQLELAVLTIDGQFAAHALGALDAPAYRVLEGRFVTEFARYAPGRLLEAEVLQRVLNDDEYDTLDWMTAVAPEKLLATNGADPMVFVHWVPGL